MDADFPFEADTSYQDIFERMAELETKAIRETQALIFGRGTGKEIIDDISSCRFIDIYGEGISLTIASNFKVNMERIGYYVFLEGERSCQIGRAIGLHRDHYNLLLSYSGETEFTLSVARLLRQNNLPILSITSDKENTLMHYSTRHLSIARMEGRITSGGISNMCSGMSFSYILDLIYISLFQKNYEANRQLMRDKIMVQYMNFPPRKQKS